MRNIASFHRLATAAVEKTASGNAEGQKITFNVIKQRMGDVLYKLTSQKFEDPGGRWAQPGVVVVVLLLRGLALAVLCCSDVALQVLRCCSCPGQGCGGPQSNAC